MATRTRIAAYVALMVLAAGCGSGEDSAQTSAQPASAQPASTQPSSTAPTGTAPSSTAPLDDGPTVSPGRANWATGYFQAALYSALLEELGFTVGDPADNEYPPAEAYLAMAEGAFDFWPNGWYSQHLTWHERELTDGSKAADHLVVIGDQVPSGALEGLVITKSVAEEHEIRSLGQINDDPALVALFDVDGDGLGDIFGCPDSWTCDNIIDELLEFNGWSNLEQVRADYPSLISLSIDRVNAGEPTIQYTWSPSGYLTQLIPGETVQWLSVGSQDNVLDGSTAGGFDFASAGPALVGDECTDDPCWIGWEPADIQVTANRTFIEDNPVAAALFEVVELQVVDIASANNRYDAGENTEDDLKRHAAEWIAANRSQVDEWLTHARAAA